MVLLLIAFALTILGLGIHQPAVLIFAGVLLLLAALMALGWRWTPLLGSVLGGIGIYVLTAKTGYPLHHLTHPKDAFGFGQLPALSLAIFSVILILFWSLAMLLSSGVAAVVQNYFQRPRRTPGWYKMALTGAICLLCGAFLLGIIQQPEVSASVAPPGTVYLNANGFSQNSITLSKGEKLTLIESGSYHHKISDGSWVNGQPIFSQQTGQPYLRNWDVSTAGASKVIGPFSTAGTYHLYCSIHTGMMLTIIVQ